MTQFLYLVGKPALWKVVGTEVCRSQSNDIVTQISHFQRRKVLSPRIIPIDLHKSSLAMIAIPTKC